MAVSTKAADLKIRRKKWVQIISPFFNEQTIGETYVFDTKGALNKNIKINLMYLIGDPRKQNIDMEFLTDKMKGDTAVLAKVVGYIVQEPSLRKLVRRGKTKIQDSFKCYTADKTPIVIKIFCIAKSMIMNSLSTKIRQTIRQLVVNKVAATDYENFMAMVVQGNMVRELKSIVDKVYPIKILEFKEVHVVSAEAGNFEKPYAEKKEEGDEEAAEEEQEEKPAEEVQQAPVQEEQPVEEVSQADEEAPVEEATEEKPKKKKAKKQDSEESE